VVRSLEEVSNVVCVDGGASGSEGREFVDGEYSGDDQALDGLEDMLGASDADAERDEKNSGVRSDFSAVG
jgi:hypothetical protein